MRCCPNPKKHTRRLTAMPVAAICMQIILLVFRFFVLVREVCIRRVVVRRKQGFKLLLRAGVIAVRHKEHEFLQRYAERRADARTHHRAGDIRHIRLFEQTFHHRGVQRIQLRQAALVRFLCRTQTVEFIAVRAAFRSFRRHPMAVRAVVHFPSAPFARSSACMIA